MDIDRVDGKYSGRAALLTELRDFVNYYEKAKQRKPERIYVKREKLDSLFALAKKDSIKLEPLGYQGIPVVLQ